MLRGGACEIVIVMRAEIVLHSLQWFVMASLHEPRTISLRSLRRIDMISVRCQVRRRSNSTDTHQYGVHVGGHHVSGALPMTCILNIEFMRKKPLI